MLPAPVRRLPVAVWESERPAAAEVARLMARLGRPPADPRHLPPPPPVTTPSPAVITSDPVVSRPQPAVITSDPALPNSGPAVPSPDPSIPSPGPDIPTPGPAVPYYPDLGTWTCELSTFHSLLLTTVMVLSCSAAAAALLMALVPPQPNQQPLAAREELAFDHQPLGQEARLLLGQEFRRQQGQDVRRPLLAGATGRNNTRRVTWAPETYGTLTPANCSINGDI